MALKPSNDTVKSSTASMKSVLLMVSPGQAVLAGRASGLGGVGGSAARRRRLTYLV
ncbi:hypothetical protein D3C71_2074890 [compost metagenome]